MNTEDDMIISGETCERMLKFVNVIEKFPILLEKSNLPDVKRKKAKAIYEIKTRLADEYEIEMSEAQIWKKLNNLKTRIKRKTDKKQTGNKKIELKEWEAKFLKYMEGEINPSICRVRGAISAGVRAPGMEVEEISLQHSESQQDESESFEPSATGSVISTGSKYGVPGTSEASCMVSKHVKGTLLKKQKNRENMPETEETKNLTLQELQRLVLLEQLHVFRLQKEILLKKKQEQDARQAYSNTQADTAGRTVHDAIPFDEEFPIFINL